MQEILFGTFIISSLVLWFWAITDITRSRFHRSNERTSWLLAVLFFPVIGSILYFQLKARFVSRKKRVFKPQFNKHIVSN